MVINNIEIKKTKLSDIEYVAKNMRLADRKEVFAFSGKKPKEALLLGYEMGEECYTAYHNNIPVIIFGVTSKYNLTRSGVPWMLSTKELKIPSVTILKISKRIVDNMKEIYYDLENYVDARNDVSINWLKWLGFEFDEPKPVGKYGVLFYRFFWKKSVDK